MEIGNMVSLRSGGPLMTVNELSKDGKDVQCVWFSDQGEVKFAVFPFQALELATSRGK